MEKKTDKYRKWWLYGAVIFFMAAIAGIVIILFFPSHKPAQGPDDQKPTVIYPSRSWF